MAEQLWWEDCDYTTFKNSAVRELKAIMALNGLKDTKSALQVLYQPGFHLELNFDEVKKVESASTSTKAATPTSSGSTEDKATLATSSPIESPPCLEDETPVSHSSSSTKHIVKSMSTPDLRESISSTTSTVLPTNTFGTAPSDENLGLLKAKTDVDLSDHRNPHMRGWSAKEMPQGGASEIAVPFHPLALLVE